MYYFLILFAFFYLSCDEKVEPVDKSNIELKDLPNPKKEEPKKEEPKPDDKKDDDKDDDDKGEESSIPFFTILPNAKYSIDENSLLAFRVEAKDPLNGGISFLINCSSKCPEGIAISGDGSFSWTPSYASAGVYSMQIVASSLAGFIKASEYFQVTVNNINRAPELSNVSISPNIVSSPTRLSCDVDALEPDGDDLYVEREWSLNDSIKPEWKNLKYIDSSSMLARDVISCTVRVKDSYELYFDGVMISSPYIFPNHAPSIESIAIINKANSSGIFRVGDTITCTASFSDVDNDIISLSSSKIYLETGSIVKASSSTSSMAEYVIREEDAHKKFYCEIEITDGSDKKSRSSLSIEVSNSTPVIQSVSLLASTSPLLTGGGVVCDVSYFDPDGDVAVKISTFNNKKGGLGEAYARGFGSYLVDTNTAYKRSYTLKTAPSASYVLNMADVRGDELTCAVTVTDSYGASSSMTSNVLTVGNSLPTISAFKILSPSTTYYTGQTIAFDLDTGDAMGEVGFNIMDLDGETIALGMENNPSSNCDTLGINFTLSQEAKKISSSAMPPPIASSLEGDRSCIKRVFAFSGGDETSRIHILLASPNLPPVINCDSLKVTQYMLTDNVTTSGLATASSQQTIADPLLCNFSDPNMGSTYTALLSSTANEGCSFSLSSTIGTSNLNAPISSLSLSAINGEGSFYVHAKISLAECLSKITLTDGGLTSNEAEFKLIPRMELAYTNNSISMNNACLISHTSSYKFNGGFTFNSSPQSSFGLTINSVAHSTGGMDKTASLISYQSFLNRLNASTLSDPLSVSHTFETYNKHFIGNNTDYRELNLKFALDREPVDSVNGYTGAYNQAPLLARGFLNRSGDQVAPSLSCLSSTCGMGSYSGAVGLKRTSLRAGGNKFCFMDQSNTLKCYNMTTGASFYSSSIAHFSDFDISNDGSTLCAIGVWGASAGKVACMGGGDYGQLGDGGTTSFQSSFSSNVILHSNSTDLTNVISIAAGYQHFCALKSDGAIYCWGLTDKSQAGSADTLQCSSKACSKRAKLMAVSAPSGDYTPIGIEASDASNFILYSSPKGGYKIKCFGSNHAGLCSSNNMISSFTDVEAVERFGGDVEGSKPYGVYSYSNATCLSNDLAKSYCFGSDGGIGANISTAYAKLGQGEPKDNAVTYPSLSNYPPASHVATQAISEKGSCAILSTGRVMCRGREVIGANEDESTAILSPLEVLYDAGGGNLLPLESMIALVAGDRFMCAVKNDGKIYCWGYYSGGYKRIATPFTSGGDAMYENCSHKITIERSFD